ncbi:GIY-YIG nuclease family protein [Cytobacillus oceanisediminis]|uniref:GIY-YIG nuclease family protein n=1 Tax=Cytobacillus oceanisediminis TaxID=665099 RepID=UPI003734D68F
MKIYQLEKVKNLPLSPGVYLMKDSLSQIIYVGKAKNLKNRVQSYFRQSKSHSPKVKKLIKHLKDFDFIVTDTEFEAFLLECKLIKDLKPIYNRMMKSPKSFAYIGITIEEEYRTIEMTYSPIENDGKLYFGPFPSKNNVETAIQGVKECYKINCSNPYKKGTACLNVSLGLCNGICLGGSAIQQYNERIDKFIAFLNGTDMWLLEEMRQMMITASEKYDFEAASKYRDYIKAVNSLLYKEKVIEFTEENNNITVIEKLNDSTIKLFLIKRTKVLFSRSYSLENHIVQLAEMIKTNITTYFKNNNDHPSIDVSRNEIDEAQIIYSYLNSNNCSYVLIPEKWLDLENHSNIDLALYKLLGNIKDSSISGE